MIRIRLMLLIIRNKKNDNSTPLPDLYLKIGVLNLTQLRKGNHFIGALKRPMLE